MKRIVGPTCQAGPRAPPGSRHLLSGGGGWSLPRALFGHEIPRADLHVEGFQRLGLGASGPFRTGEAVEEKLPERIRTEQIPCFFQAFLLHAFEIDEGRSFFGAHRNCNDVLWPVHEFRVLCAELLWITSQRFGTR